MNQAMSQGEFARWYANSGVIMAMGRCIGSRCNNEADAADFEQEAWIRIMGLRNCLATGIIIAEMGRAVDAAYRRELRHRGHEIPMSFVSGGLNWRP